MILETVDFLSVRGKIRLPLKLKETDQYEMLAIGPFSKLIHRCSGSPWAIPKAIVQPVLESWHQAMESNSKIYPGPQYRLEKMKISGKGNASVLTVETSLTSYNLYVGARDEEELTPLAQKENLKAIELAAQPLNASAVLILSDGKIPIQKRSAEVDVDPGMTYLFGGQVRDCLSDEEKNLATQRGRELAATPMREIKPEELYVYHDIKRGAVSPLSVVVEQIFSETGVPEEKLDLKQAGLLGLVQAKGNALHPELVFVIPCSLSSQEVIRLKGKDAWEGKLYLVSADPQRISKEVRNIGESVPILAGALNLYTHFTK